VLSDFNSCCQSLGYLKLGTIAYTAPEALRHFAYGPHGLLGGAGSVEGISFQSDIYSLGVTLAEFYYCRDGKTVWHRPS
jgi:serine/threonine protein kinase